MKATGTLPRRTIDLRANNRQVVLRCLYFSGPVSRVEISQITTLSVATITHLLAELIQEGIVIETGLADSEGGRPRTLLGINPHYGSFIGVAVGETHVQLELFDLTLQLQHAVHYPALPQETSPQEYVEYIISGFNELIAQTGIDLSSILSMGIGLPGVVERFGAQHVTSPLWHWQSVPLGDMLRARIPIPVYLDNGAKALTLAESWFGAGRGSKNLIAILLGTGIGAGVISEANLYRGPTNSAGEFGHTTIVLGGRLCRCGSQGCLEAYAGAPGIIATLRELMPGSSLPDGDETSVIVRLVENARQGDAPARQTLHITAEYLGASIANLIKLFNPELIVLGGWLGMEIGDAITDDLGAILQHYALPPHSPVRIELSQLGTASVCIGAACLSLDQFLSGQLVSPRKAKA